MPPAPIPINEAARLLALWSYNALDTKCETDFDTIVSVAARTSGCPVSLVSLVDQSRQWFKARHGFPDLETPRELSFCAHAILDASQPLVIADATLDARFADNLLVTGAPHIRFYAGFPLVTPNGFVLGTLCVADAKPRALMQAELDLLQGLAHVVITILEQRHMIRKIQTFALTDSLTMLPNRAVLLNALDQAIADQAQHSRAFGLLYLDLDGFKRINDRLGHRTGDRVLEAVADVLRASIREEDTAARFGGDEFVILLRGGDVIDTREVAERIRTRVEAIMATHGWAITASIGAVEFHTKPESAQAALEQADLSMYAAKLGGKNRVRWHNSAMRAATLVSTG